MPAGAGGSGGGAAGGGGGLLNSIIGNIKKTNAASKPSAPGARPITKADVMTREEKLMDARRAFERTHGDRMRRELVDRETSDGDDDDGGEAYIEFPPMDKVWRNILHELAADLRLHSESIELEHPAEGGDKYVVVYRKPPVVELSDAEEARRAAAAAAVTARASAGMKRGEALTDRAPMMPEGGIPEGELKVVGTVKRDLRSVAEVSAEMRKRKREGGE